LRVENSAVAAKKRQEEGEVVTAQEGWPFLAGGSRWGPI
jgi:hypothetical protein